MPKVITYGMEDVRYTITPEAAAVLREANLWMRNPRTGQELVNVERGLHWEDEPADITVAEAHWMVRNRACQPRHSAEDGWD